MDAQAINNYNNYYTVLRRHVLAYGGRFDIDVIKAILHQSNNDCKFVYAFSFINF